jgi:hypothetical protein
MIVKCGVAEVVQMMEFFDFVSLALKISQYHEKIK